MWPEILLQLCFIVFTLLVIFKVIYFTLCHDVIYLPLINIQVWQEEYMRGLKFSASAENLACLFLFLSFTDCLSRHLSSSSPRASFNLLKMFFLSLPSMSFVSSVPTICWLIPAVLKHSSCSKKQLWLTSPRAAQFRLWLFTFPSVSFPFHFIDWKFDSIFFCSGLASFIPTILCCCLYLLLFFCPSSFLLTE